MGPTGRREVFTIGYERFLDPAGLAAELTAAGVGVVVDVREVAVSRRRGYSKRGLRDALNAAGLRYRHARDLGNPKAYRELYRAGQVAAARDLYRAHLRDGPPTWPALLRLAMTLDQEDPVCLLCVEDDPDRCHRTVVAEELRSVRPGLAIVHL
jgi:uncharacterized protein (DUF488 family)